MRKARALRLIRRLRSSEAEVSDWEGEFLTSVEGRIDRYGRAFADPEKGARDAAVSVQQQRKLKEIGAKLAGEPTPSRKGGLQRRRPLGARKRSTEGEPGDGD